MKKSTIASIALVVVVAVGILAYTIADNFVNGEGETEEVAEVTIEEDFEEVDLEELVEEGEVEEVVSEVRSVGEADPNFRDEIGSVHSTMNRITGHGYMENYKEAIHPNWETNWEMIEDDLEELASRIEVIIDEAESETLREDLENYVTITRHAAEERKANSLLYSHRVIHDVDTVLNGREDKEIFGAANYVEREGHETTRFQEVEKILNEIEEGSGE